MTTVRVSLITLLTCRTQVMGCPRAGVAVNILRDHVQRSPCLVTFHHRPHFLKKGDMLDAQSHVLLMNGLRKVGLLKRSLDSTGTLPFEHAWESIYTVHLSVNVLRRLS